MSRVFGIDFTTLSQDELVTAIAQREIPAGNGLRSVWTANVDHIVHLDRNPEFRAAYQNAWTVTADGAPVVAYGRLRGASFTRLTGADLFRALLPALCPDSSRCFFVAPTKTTARGLNTYLLSRGFSPSSIAYDVPPRGFEEDPDYSEWLAQRIREHTTTHLFFGVGAPKSEIWIHRHRRILGDCYAMSLGAAFEFFIGTRKRAPLWVQRSGLEWFWRFLLEPHRLFRRYFLDSWHFLAVVKKDLTRDPSAEAKPNATSATELIGAPTVVDHAGAPAVSVIMPSYNVRGCVTRAIDSVLAQTFGDFELIVVDDASSDGTAARVEHACAGDPRIKLLRMSRNRGPAYTRNVGFSAARAPWIALLDADDAWRPDRLERLMDQSEQVDAVFDNLVGYDAEADTETGVLFPGLRDGELSIEALLSPALPDSDYNFGYLKPLLRREFLVAQALTYDVDLRTSEDLLLYLEMLIRGARTRLLNEPLYVYTTPVGHQSRSRSSHSKSTPHDGKLRVAMERVLEYSTESLTPSERDAILRRIAFLREIEPISNFYHARRSNSYGTMAMLLATRRSVQRDVFGKMMQRLAGPAPVRSD